MKILGIVGRIIFAIPMAMSGYYHFAKPHKLKRLVPDFLPFPNEFWIYFTGVCLLLIALSLFIGKKMRLASILLGVMLVSFAVFIHMKGFLKSYPIASTMFVKDMALAGAAFFMASKLKD